MVYLIGRMMAALNSRKSSVVLVYNDKKPMTITDDMASFTAVDNASGEADTITIDVQNRGMKWFKNKWFPKSTDFVKASIKVEHWKKQNDNRTAFLGRYCIDEFSAGGYPGTASISGISIPIHSSFNVTERNKTYKKTSVQAILEEIARRADIKLAFSAKNQKLDEISQDGKNDMAFAFSICSDYDMCMKVYNNKLVVYDQTDYEKKKAVFTLTPSDFSDDNTYNFKRSVACVYDGVKFQYQDKDGKNIIYKYVIPGKKGKRLLNISGSADSHDDAARKAKAQLAGNLRDAVTASFNLMGDPLYQAGKVVKVSGFGGFDGRYFIDQVTHSKNEKYTSSLQCHKCVTNIN